MNISFYIAKRYLFAKRKRSVVQIISLVSLVGVSVGTMALIIVLSVLNGLTGVAVSLFNTFNPPLLIEANEGKTFHLSNFPEKEIKQLAGITYFIPCVQENALIAYKNKQYIVTLKGVGDGYDKMSKINQFIREGEFKIQSPEANFAVIGSDINYELGIMHKNECTPFTVYIPKREQKFGLNAQDAFSNEVLNLAGVYTISAEIDGRYVITNPTFVRSLLDYAHDEVTSVELGVSSEESNMNTLQTQVQKIVGKNFSVKTRFEQQALFHQTVKMERIAIFLIMLFIIFIATFNIIGSLSLLMLDKKKDVKILQSMGANNSLVKRIFLTEGLLISFTGAIVGLVLGGLICWLQQQFGFIGMGSDNFVVSAFPVQLNVLDFILVFLSVMAIGFASVWFTVISRAKILFEKTN